MAVNVKNTPESKIPQGSTFIPPILEPGNFKVKIHSIFLQPERDPKFGEKLIMRLETEPIGGSFKGFQIDKDDKTKGNFLGRTGFVGYNRYGYRDFVLNSGEMIEKEVELQIAIRDICQALGIMKWYDDQDGKWDKPEDNMAAFIKAFDAEKPFANIWFHVCLAGREYMDASGKYVKHELWIAPKHRTLGIGMSTDPTKVQKYFTSEHLITLSANQKTPSSNNETTVKITEAGYTKTIDNQSNAHFLAEINAPVEQIYHKDVPADQPVRPKITSPQEAAFMAEGKAQIKTEKIVETPFTDEIDKDAESTTGIVIGNSEEKMPWE